MSQKFEESIERLERIVEKLEAGKIPLEESLKLFEEGVGLVRSCSIKLNDIEKKVKVMVKKQDKVWDEEDLEESEEETASSMGKQADGQAQDVRQTKKKPKKDQTALF